MRSPRNSIALSCRHHFASVAGVRNRFSFAATESLSFNTN